jgi:hypothetical protein
MINMGPAGIQASIIIKVLSPTLISTTPIHKHRSGLETPTLYGGQAAPIDWLPLAPAVTQVNPVVIGSKARHPNAARLFRDCILSKEGQEQLKGFQPIPVRKDVEANPPRRFRRFKYVIESPEQYQDFDATVKQYLNVFKLR